MRTVIPAVALLLVAFNARLGAQATPSLEPGSKIRVSLLDARLNTLVGTYVGTVADSLRMHTEATSSVRSVPFSSVFTLEASRDRKSYALEGLGIGFVAGAATGAAIGAMVYYDETSTTRSQLVVSGAAFFGACGAVVGVLAGAMITKERWERVSLDHLPVSLAPQRDGSLALGLSVRY